MLFHKLVEEYQNNRYTNINKAKSIITKMKLLEKDNDAYASRSSFYEAQLCYQEDKTEESLALAVECISNLSRRPYCRELGKSYNLIGKIYIDRGDVLQAIDYLLRALELVEPNHDIETSCLIYNNLGCTFNHLNDYETAIIYFKKAFTILSNIDIYGNVYMVIALNLALMHCDVKEYDKAKRYYNIALNCEKINSHKPNQILCSIILIKMAYHKRNYVVIYEEMDRIADIVKHDGIAMDDFKELIKLIRQIMDYRLKNKLYMLLLLLDKEAKGRAVLDAHIEVITCKIEYYKMIEDTERVNDLMNEFYLISIKKERENEKAFIESANVKLQMQALIRLQRETEENSRRYKEKAERDELTGLYNRTILKNDFEALFFRAKEQQLHIGVIIFDINYFKQFNDCYGHVEGDRCIREITSIMLRLHDDKIRFVRYGGDEFLGFFFDMDKYQIKSLSSLIQSEIRALNIENKNAPDEEKIISITQGGYLGVPDGKENLYDFIRKADDALYEGKRSKNRIVIHQR